MSNFAYLQWHITNACSNRCKHCYQSEFNGPETSLETARLILDDFAEFCKLLKVEPSITITGGDPLLNPDFFSILNAAKEICPKIGILGNPENLNAETVSRLKSANILHYQLSIDGLEKTHDAIRTEGSFQRTIEAAELLKKEGVRMTVMSTVSSVNHNEMTDVMKLAYSLGASNWYFSRHTPEHGDCGMSANDYMAFLNNTLSKHHEFESSCGASKPKKEPLISLISVDKIDPSPRIKSGCSMGGASLALLPDNTLMACRRHPDSILGKWTPTENFIQHFLLNPKMQKYREINEIEGCKNCKLLYYCRGCRAAAFAATGNHNGKDPQCPVADITQERR